MDTSLEKDAQSSVKSTSATLNESSPAPYPPKNVSFRIVIFCLCICGFLSALDTLILSASLPAIATAFQATTVDAYWCSSAFLFAQAIVQLTYSALAGVFSRRYCMVTALGVFAVASVLCATARNIQWLIAARTLQGVGTGGMNALMQLILTDLVPLAERPKYTGIITLFAAAGLLSGGLSGAAIVQSASWRIIFWINPPLCLFTMIGFICCLRVAESYCRDNHASAGKAVIRLDWLGLIIVTGSLAGILYAVSTGNAVRPWASGKTLAPLICGIVGLFVFAAYEQFVARSAAILPGRLFSSFTAVSGYTMTMIHAMIVWVVAYYFFLYLMFCSHSYLASAVLMLPVTVTFPLAAGVTGFIIGRTQRYKALNIISLVLFLVALAGFTALSQTSNIGVQVMLLLIVGTGGGIFFISKVFMVQSAVDERDVFMATAIVATATSIGECFGVAVAGSLFQNRWDALLSRETQRAELSMLIRGSDAEKSAGVIAGLAGEVAEVYVRVTMGSFRMVWIVMTVFAGVALVSSLFAKGSRLKS